MIRYFPPILGERFPDAIEAHRLRREIIATAVAGDIADHIGPGVGFRVREEVGCEIEDIARAYLVVVATFEAVLLAGAVPVFVDVDETMCLDPDSVERAIGPKTRAVVVVHMCGSMARIDRLAALSKKHGLRLIEDTAQAPECDTKPVRAAEPAELTTALHMRFQVEKDAVNTA